MNDAPVDPRDRALPGGWGPTSPAGWAGPVPGWPSWPGRRRPLADVARSVAASGSEALTLPADVSDREACDRAVEKTLDRFGRLDGLVNNAGILPPVMSIERSDPEAWVRNIAVNLLGPYYLIRAAIPALRAAGGRVVNISSGAAVKPIGAWSAYCAAKAALTHLTAVVAVEEPRIIAVALRPGVIDTEMQAVIRREGPSAMDPEKAAYFTTAQGGRRAGTPLGAGPLRGMARAPRAPVPERPFRRVRRPARGGAGPRLFRNIPFLKPAMTASSSACS